MRSYSGLFRKLKSIREAFSTRTTSTATISRSPIGSTDEQIYPGQLGVGDKHEGPVSAVSSSQKAPVAAANNGPLYENGDLIAERYHVTQYMEGALAYLYVAYDKIEDLNFAIKQPKRDRAKEANSFSRILQAAQAWSNLGMHPHIAHCYFIRQVEDVPLLVVEYVEGGNLRQRIESGVCADLRVSLDLAIQFCHGMEHAHGNDLVHRNLKPENILVSQAGVLQITDFGMTSQGQEDQGRTGSPQGSEAAERSSTAIGTLAYMAPEQLRDPRLRSDTVPEGVWYDSDIYSFGVCLWEMIVGHRPYYMAPSVAGDAPDPRDSVGGIPASLRSLLCDVIAIDRRQRPQDFSVIRRSLNNIYQELFQSDAPSYTPVQTENSGANELNNLGCEYLERGDVAQARSCFENVGEMGLTHPQAVYNLSLIKWRSGEITEDEVLWRLDYCKSDSTVERRPLAELIAHVQAERFDPHAAKALLEDYPGRYEALFGDRNVRQAQCLFTLEGHRGWINCVALTPDGSRGLSGSDDRTLRTWNLATGECLYTLAGHKDRVNAVAITSDGRWGLSGSDDKTLRLWDLITGSCTRILNGHESEVTCVAMSADGSVALSGSKDKTLVLWDLQTGQSVRSLAGHAGWVRSVAMTPDGRWGLSGSNDTTLRFWDLKSGRYTEISEEHVRGVKSVAISDDGRTGLSGSRDGTLCLWNLKSGVRLRTLVGHTTSVESVAVTADMKWVLSASRDTTLRLWELETGQCIQLKKRRRGFVLSVATTPDGQRVLSGNHDNTIQLWELPLLNRYRAPFRIAPHRRFTDARESGFVDRIKPITGLESSQEVSVLDRTSTIEPSVVTTATEVGGQKPGNGKEQHPNYSAVEQKTKNRTAGELTLGMYRESGSGQDNRQEALAVDRAPAAGRGEVQDTECADHASTTRQHEVAQGVTDTGGWVALRETWKSREYAEDASTVRSYGQLLADGRATRLLEAKALHRLVGDSDHGGFYAVVQSRDGRLGLSGNADATVGLWNLENGESIRTFRGHTDIVSAVAITPDGRLGLSASADSTLRFWDLGTGECLCILGENANAFVAVDMTSDGRWALAGQRIGFVNESGLLSLWDLKARALVHSWEGHRDQVRSVALTPDGRWGLSGGADNSVRRWNLETYRDDRTLQGHTQAVNAVAITPDGHWGLSGSHDATLRLWDLQSGACVRKLVGHSEAIRSVSFTADGRFGLSGSFDKSLKLWDLEEGKCIATLQHHNEYVTSVALSADGSLGLSASMDNTLVRWRFIWNLEFSDKLLSHYKVPQFAG